jgi:hypothetical protein
MTFANWAPPQRDCEELLDEGRAAATEIEASLRDLRRINAWLGNRQLVVIETVALLQKYQLLRAHIIDIGTGSADLPVAISKAATRQNIATKVLALDCKLLHLHIAQLMNDGEEGSPSLLCGDAFRLPLADNSVDLVTSSLFLHHFRPAQIEQLLQEFSRVSRVGWVMIDLVRHYVPLVFFRATWPIFARSHLTRHDGAASFRRGYTVNEMRAHIAAMQTGAARVEVKPHFFRVSVVGQKAIRPTAIHEKL